LAPELAPQGADSAWYSRVRRHLSRRRVVAPEAINLKFIAAPLTGNQLKELIQIPQRRK
jgi:hypothetical protein